jgi:glutamate racemase
MRSDAIGVFDSGVGGLSVLREIRALLPLERTIYVADSAHIPYGAKSTEFVRRRAVRITEFLRDAGTKAVVVACNTATAAAVSALRATSVLPIIGMEPGVKPAVAASRSRVVGVLATPGTLRSQKFATLVQSYGGGVEVVVQPCPGLVEQVERGDTNGLHTRALVQRYVMPLLERGADTLVLGCTHYPFLAHLIREVAGSGVTLVDTGHAVARELKRRLAADHLLTSATQPGGEEYWTSGDPAVVASMVSALIQREVRVQPLPPGYSNIDE